MFYVISGFQFKMKHGSKYWAVDKDRMEDGNK